MAKSTSKKEPRIKSKPERKGANFYIEDELLQKLRVLSALENIPQSDLVNEAISDLLKKHNKTLKRVSGL